MLNTELQVCESLIELQPKHFFLIHPQSLVHLMSNTENVLESWHCNFLFCATCSPRS